MESIESQIDFYFELVNKLGFFGAQIDSGYSKIGTTQIRVKDHEANYCYFEDDAMEGIITKIISVNYCDSNCKNEYRMTKEQFNTIYPNIEVIEFNFDFEDVEVEEIASKIKEEINN